MRLLLQTFFNRIIFLSFSFQVRPLASLMVATGVIDLTVMCAQCFNRVIKLFALTSDSNQVANQFD